MKESIGFDICSSKDATIPPGKRGMIPTDLVLIPTEGCYTRLAVKSGLARKFGLDVLVGIIDPDFQGDVKVVVQTQSETQFEIHCEDKIAQGILEKALFHCFKEEGEAEETERGSLGFGVADEPPITEAKREEEPTILPDLAFA
ncbi:uncharacterized protein [Ambystoma mexicanum]|uniref:uncharacterized protein n=1 Tax=Ambystoma mexicanum TaxID=8296 RepID=UPI0037E982D1